MKEKDNLKKQVKEKKSKPSKVDGLEKEIKNIKDEIKKEKDRYFRLFAEFENYKKRTDKESIELIKTANESLLKKLLPIFDDLKRGLVHSNNQKLDEIVQGFGIIDQKIKDVLKQVGLNKIEVKKGMDLDTDFHEAISQIEDEKLKGKIVDIVEDGYILNDKVIRYSKVVIGK